MPGRWLRLVAPAALVCAATSTPGFAQMGAPIGGQPTKAPSSQYQSSFSPSTSSPPGVTGTKRADPGPLGNWYATVELRHHYNSYYGTDGRYAYSEPSMHARLQFGTLLYGGALDAYATLGVIKQPDSQQIMQRRPEVEVDLYPVKSDHFTILQYNIAKFPVAAANAGQQLDDEKDDYSSSTTYLVGLNPTAKVPLITGPSRLDFKIGLDTWTKMYSRKQYTNTYYQGENDDTDDEHMTLVGGDTGANGQPIEDTAMHYQGEALAGFAFAPAFVKGLKTETTVHYLSKFDPIYTSEPDGRIDYRYGVYRYSYFRLRLHYDLTDRVSVADDFYDFHEGFFAEDRRDSGGPVGAAQGGGLANWRYRNIARLTCRL